MKTLLLIAVLAGATVTPVTDSGKGSFGSVFSPDGKFVSYHDDRRLLVREIATGQTKVLSENSVGYRDHVYSADGKDLYFSEYEPSTSVTAIFRVPSSGGAKEVFLTKSVSPIFSSDGKWIAYLSLADRSHPQRLVAKLSAPREGRVLHNAYLPSFSPNGKAVAFVRTGAEGPSFVMAELEPWVEHSVALRTPSMNLGSPTWSPDSESLLMVLGRPGNVQVSTLSMATGELRKIATWPGDLEATAWPAGSNGIFVMARPKHSDVVWQLWHCRLSSGEWTQLTDERFGFVPYVLRAASHGATLALLQPAEAPHDWWDGFWENMSRTFDPQRAPNVGGGPRIDVRGPMFNVALVQIRK